MPAVTSAQILISACASSEPAGTTTGAFIDTAVSRRIGRPASAATTSAIASSAMAAGSTDMPSIR